MSQRLVALNTSHIKINEMTAYYNNKEINIYNNTNITGNITISNNLNIFGTDELEHNNNIISSDILYIFDAIDTSGILKNIITIGNIEQKNLNLYIGNTYIFNQSNNNINQQIIISKKKLEYNRNTGIIERVPYSIGVTYSSNGSDFSSTDNNTRGYLKFIPTERGTYYIVTKNKNTQIKVITIYVLDNVYKYGSFITNSGLGLSQNLNIGGNLNVNNGMFYVVNDPQYTKFKSVGVGTMVPRLGFDFTNLPNYKDAVALPRTLGLGTSSGNKAMMRYDTGVNMLQGYIDDEWESLGGVKDKDKDTYISVSIENRNDEMEFYSNNYTRLTILDDDLTRVGIATSLPNATLEIKGNLNVIPDGAHSGAIFGNDSTDSDRYVDVLLINDTTDTTIHFKGNNGGLENDIDGNVIRNMNNKNVILTTSNSNLVEDITGTDTITYTGIGTSTLKSNTENTVNGKYYRTYENDTIETNIKTHKIVINDSSTETYHNSFNSNTSGNFMYNVNKIKSLFIKNDTTETFSINSNITIKEDLIELITGTSDLTVTNTTSETLSKSSTVVTSGYKIDTIYNNLNTLINTTYNINIHGNLIETYLRNVNKTISSSNTLEINGTNSENIIDNNTILYKDNLQLRNTGFLNQLITLNKDIDITGVSNETYQDDVLYHIDIDKTKNIYGNYKYNLSKSYYHNVNGNKNINITNNINNIINGESYIRLTGTTTNNIHYNNTFDSNFKCNINKISNLIVYNTFDKYITNHTTEIYKKSKHNHLLLKGHQLSGPNTISFEIENIDLFTTNYIKIVESSVYDSNVAQYPNFYVFPGDGDDILGDPVKINDWFIFKPGTSANSWIIINSYYASSASSVDPRWNDVNNQYAILGPTDEDKYAVILWNNWVNTFNYNENHPSIYYNYKFILGPRKHQLEYNLTTHYIKIFMVGAINANMTLIKLNSLGSSIQAIQTHPNISYVGSSDYRFNNADTDPGLYDNENEFNRFIFIYIDGTEEITNGIITKSQYYIYNSELDKYLKNNNNTLDFETTSTLTNNHKWYLESVYKNDSSHNSDIYYIHNNNKYLQIDSNDSTISLANILSNNKRQHFTFYYIKPHRANINSATLTYNNVNRIKYLTLNYKKIQIYNTSFYVNKTLNGSNYNQIENSASSTAFLFIYNDTITIPGSGTVVGTFKIYCPNENRYLFNDPNKNWVIESVNEDFGTHEGGHHIIKDYNNSNPIEWLYHDTNTTPNVLKLKLITGKIPDDAKFLFVDTMSGFPDGELVKNISFVGNKNITRTHNLSIKGNFTETTKSNFNINTTGDVSTTIKYLSNLNVYQNNIETYAKYNKTIIHNNIEETVSKSRTKFVKQNNTENYKSNSNIYISGDLTSNITSAYSNKIYDTKYVYVTGDTNETYKSNFDIKCNKKTKTINGAVTELLAGTSDMTIDNLNTNILKHNQIIKTTENTVKIIGLDNNINITKNSNIIITGNKNITIPLSKIITISGKKDTSISKFNKKIITGDVTEDYHGTYYKTISNNLNEIVSGLRTLLITGDTDETYQTDKTIYVDNNVIETVSGAVTLNVSGDTTINSASTFNLTCEKNINLSSNGYVHITNTNTGTEGAEEQRALVVDGGYYQKKDGVIMGDLKLAGNLNVYGSDSSLFKTEDYDINDPLITLGLTQENLGNYSGIISQCFVNSDKKFAGLVRNNLNTYSILNNINLDTNDAEEYSKTDMDNAFSVLTIQKYSNFIAKQIVSLEPNINTNGDLYVAKNIFIGIADTPPASANNSFTLNIGSNINTTQNDFTIKTNKDIIYNISNSKNISITSSANYTTNALQNKNAYIHNNLVETIIGSHDKSIKNTTTETFKANYDINTIGKTDTIIKKNNIRTIKNDYNINTLQTVSNTIKNNYNLNTFKNTFLKYNTNHQFYSDNLTNTIYNNNTIHNDTNYSLTINGTTQYNITGTNSIYVKLDNTENYRNTSKTITGNLTDIITGNTETTINGTFDTTVIQTQTETYGNNRTLRISGNLQEIITGNNINNLHQVLDKTIDKNNTNIYKKTNNVTISENLNTVISGNYNIIVLDNVNQTFNKITQQIVGSDNNETYKSTHKLNVYDTSLFNVKTANYNCNIDQNLTETIKKNYEQNIGSSLSNYSTIIINKNATITDKKYKTLNIHTNSKETFGNTYNITYNNTSVETYRHNKHTNIKNNFTSTNEKYYSQHTVGISTSNFRCSYNTNLLNNLTETYFTSTNENIKINNILSSTSDLSNTTNGNKTNIVETNQTIINKSTKNHEVEDTCNETMKNICNISNLNNYTKEIRKDSSHFVADNTTIVYNNTHYSSVLANLMETYHGTMNTLHNTGVSNTDNKSTINMEKSTIYKIGTNYTKNIHNNFEQNITVNLNKTCIGDTTVTYNNNSFIENHTNIVKNIYKKYTNNTLETYNKHFDKNKTITISKNNNTTIHGNLTSTIYDNVNETYNSSQHFTKGNLTNTSTFNTTYEGVVDNKITDTFYRRIKNNSLETYSVNSDLTTGANLKNTITGTHSLHIVNASTEVFQKSSDVSSASNVSIYDQEFTKYIEKTSDALVGASTIITNNNNNTYIGGKHHITNNHSSNPNIEWTSSGGIKLKADANISKNNNINFTTRTGIKNIVSYEPQIINTSNIGSDNISEFVNQTSHYSLFTNTPKSLYIIYINPHDDLTTLINNNKNIYIRLNLPNGQYNGQIIKIMLHPVFETTFSTITTRLTNNLQTNVVIRITDFCDTNDNEYISVDLLLNRGGMALSLIYIDNDSTDNIDGYWMFLNNSYTYA